MPPYASLTASSKTISSTSCAATGPSYRMKGRDAGRHVRSRGQSPVLTSRFGTTALSASRLVIAVIVGMSLGIVSALKQNTSSTISALLCYRLYGIPNFVLGVFFILLFAVVLNCAGHPPSDRNQCPQLQGCLLPAPHFASLRLPGLPHPRQHARGHAPITRTARATGLMKSPSSRATCSRTHSSRWSPSWAHPWPTQTVLYH